MYNFIGDKMKNVIKNYIQFYRKNLEKKHIICTIISIILFIIFLIVYIRKFSKLQNINYNPVSYFTNLKEYILLSFIIIFAGITPYFFLSVLGFLSTYTIARKIAIMYVISNNLYMLIFYCIIAFVISFAYSLCIATGIYYCTLSSKKFTYSQKKGVNFNDLKISLYKLRKNEEKLKECEEKIEKKLKSIEKLNAKIPYLNLAISLSISVLILVFTTLII